MEGGFCLFFPCKLMFWGMHSAILILDINRAVPSITQLQLAWNGFWAFLEDMFSENTRAFFCKQSLSPGALSVKHLQPESALGFPVLWEFQELSTTRHSHVRLYQKMSVVRFLSISQRLWIFDQLLMYLNFLSCKRLYTVQQLNYTRKVRYTAVDNSGPEWLGSV